MHVAGQPHLIPKSVHWAHQWSRVWKEWVRISRRWDYIKTVNSDGVISVNSPFGMWYGNPARENGFTVITTVGMASFPFTGEWVGGTFHNGKSWQPSTERMDSLSVLPQWEWDHSLHVGHCPTAAHSVGTSKSDFLLFIQL